MRFWLSVFSLAGGLVCAGFPVHAIDVDDAELKTAKRALEFENNTNPVPRDAWNSLSEIRAIGAALGAALLEQRGKPYIVVGDKKRYLLSEIVPEVPKGPALSADILELGSRAGVDSIRNLRLILAGYLETAYAYTPEYADELALYITVYNAVYRQRIERFSEKYCKQVVSLLSKKKTGLSTTFKEWPGRTQIVVPLFDENGMGEPVVEIKAILDREVIAELEKEKPGISEDPRSVVAKERKAARDASDAAEKKRSHLDDELKKAKEKESDLHARIIKLKEEVEAGDAELHRLQQSVILNKFGQPIQGNEAAKAQEALVKKQKELLQKLEQDALAAQESAQTLERRFKEADADAAQKQADAERMGA